jgi:hypothetical protein
MGREAKISGTKNRGYRPSAGQIVTDRDGLPKIDLVVTSSPNYNFQFESERPLASQIIGRSFSKDLLTNAERIERNGRLGRR